MGRKCFVPHCRSGYDSCPERVSLFSPPRDADKLKIWIKNIPRDDRILSRNDRVCEKHFETNFIIREWNNGFVTIPLGIPHLSEEAVPTIFPDRPSHLNPKTSKRRRLIRNSGGVGCMRSKRKNETCVVAQADVECENDDLKPNSNDDQGPHCQERWNKIRTTFIKDSKNAGQTGTKNGYSEHLSFLRGYREKIEQDCIDLDDEPMQEPIQDKIEMDTVEIIEDEDEEEEEEEDEEEDEENLPVTPITSNTSANPVNSVATMTFPGNTYAFPSAMAPHLNVTSGLPVTAMTPMIFTQSNYPFPPGPAAKASPVTRITSENQVTPVAFTGNNYSLTPPTDHPVILNSGNRVTSLGINHSSTPPIRMNRPGTLTDAESRISSPGTFTGNRVSFTPPAMNHDNVISRPLHANSPDSFTGNNYPSPMNPASSPVTVPGSKYSRPAPTPPVTVAPEIPPSNPPVIINSNHMDSNIQRLISRKTTANGKKTISNSNQDSPAVTLMRYILSKQEAAAAAPEHPVDAFLKSLAPTLKTFTPYYLNRVKSRIFADVQELELQMLQGDQPRPGGEENDEQQRVQKEGLATKPKPSEPPVPRPKQIEDIVKIEFDSSSRCPSPAPDDQEYEIERGTTSEFVSWPSTDQNSSSTLVYDSTQIKLPPPEHG